MDHQEIRWQQRLTNFSSALLQLDRAVTLAQQKELSDLEKQGLIQIFEFTHELAWNVMKDYALFQGDSSIAGSRDATREAFRMNLITDGNGWMEMIKSRNQSSHTYIEEIAEEIAERVVHYYCAIFKGFEQVMIQKKEESQNELF